MIPTTPHTTAGMAKTNPTQNNKVTMDVIPKTSDAAAQFVLGFGRTGAGEDEALGASKGFI